MRNRVVLLSNLWAKHQEIYCGVSVDHLYPQFVLGKRMRALRTCKHNGACWTSGSHSVSAFFNRIFTQAGQRRSQVFLKFSSNFLCHCLALKNSKIDTYFIPMRIQLLHYYPEKLQEIMTLGCD